jgi:hypothetical protein
MATFNASGQRGKIRITLVAIKYANYFTKESLVPFRVKSDQLFSAATHQSVRAPGPGHNVSPHFLSLEVAKHRKKVWGLCNRKWCSLMHLLHGRKRAISNALDHTGVTPRNCFLSEFLEKAIGPVHGLLI